MNNEQPENKTIETAVVEDKQTEKNTKPSTSELAPVSELTSWPGAFGIYKYSKKAVMLNVGTILTVFYKTSEYWPTARKRCSKYLSQYCVNYYLHHTLAFWRGQRENFSF
jgi:hypothetical protein